MNHTRSLPHVAVLFLGRKRPGFDEVWGAAMAERVKTAVGARPWDAFFCPTKAVDDGSLRAAVEACRGSGAHTMIALQTTMSDGRLAPFLSQFWGGPVVLWATPEKPDGDLVSSCSLVGTHLFASIFARLNHPFEVVSGAPEDPRLLVALESAVRATSAVGALKTAKLGLVGYHAPGFINMQVNPFDPAEAFGAQVYHMGQQELLSTMDAFTAAEKEADLRATKALGLPIVDISDEELGVQSAYYLAIRKIIQDERLDALAIRCWPELPNLTGQWPYLAMVRLLDEGYPVNMEGDLDGALSMLILRLLGLEAGYLSDWLEHDAGHISLWHGGNTPGCLALPAESPRARTVARHFNSNKPAVVDGWITAGRPVTLLRIWPEAGDYIMVVREGVTVQPSRHLRGTNGRVALDEDVHELFDELAQAGMPHHLTVFPGHHSELLSRVARLLRMQMV